jgi:butyrate response factor 1
VKKAESLLRAITERYENCFFRLRDTTAELADLRLERVRLGAENLHLSLLLEELDAAEQSKQASAVVLTPPPKPAQAEAASTPKSISIRSKGFLSKNQPQGVATPQRLRVRASQAMEVSPQFLPFITFNFTPHILLPVHLEGNLHRRAH